jgi:hypothetical protein
MKVSKKLLVLAATTLFVLAFAGPALAAPEPYLSPKVDPTNPNQLWTVERHGDYVQILLKGGKLALDSNNGKGRVYLNDKVDATNDSQLWMLRKEGDHVMIIPKGGGKVALDGNNGKGKPYFSGKPDTGNDNQLWTLRKQGDNVQILLKGGKFALDANAGK